MEMLLNRANTTGFAGGILFRAYKAKTSFYTFTISSGGYYYLKVCNSGSCRMIDTGASDYINRGYQINVIKVIARGSTFDLIVNGQQIPAITDLTYSQGMIGVVAEDSTMETFVGFRNAQVTAYK